MERKDITHEENNLLKQTLQKHITYCQFQPSVLPKYSNLETFI